MRTFNPAVDRLRHRCAQSGSACLPWHETQGLKEKYGKQIIFHGGVDNQNVLPFGSAEDVRNEVKMLMNTLGSGKEGFICASCHNIQAGTPIENILAMIETAKNM